MAQSIGFVLVCHCSTQVMVPQEALGHLVLAPGETFAFNCPLCHLEIYSLQQAGPVDENAVPPSPEVRQYHAQQGREWGRPS